VNWVLPLRLVAAATLGSAIGASALILLTTGQFGGAIFLALTLFITPLSLIGLCVSWLVVSESSRIGRLIPTNLLGRAAVGGPIGTVFGIALMVLIALAAAPFGGARLVSELAFLGALFGFANGLAAALLIGKPIYCRE
jgi:uncharacterized membrane protein